jgi:ABC-type uncharacterized transport system substrate-binding protein
MDYLKTMKIRSTLAVALILAPLTAAEAHPHVFVDVEVTVIYDDRGAVGVQLDWTYDEYFSLLMTTDLGIDLDGDMRLTDAEAETLNASVTQWPDGYTGDLEVSQNDQIVELGARENHSVTLEDGLVRETHIRPLSGLTDAPLTIRAYDPFYYVDYQLAGPVRVIGSDNCTVEVTPPDLNEAYSLVDELLYGRPASDVGPDEAFPEVGREFADTIVVQCAS